MVATLVVGMIKCLCKSLTRWSMGMIRLSLIVRPTGSTSSDAMLRMGAELTASERRSRGPKYNPAQPKLVCTVWKQFYLI